MHFGIPAQFLFSLSRSSSSPSLALRRRLRSCGVEETRSHAARSTFALSRQQPQPQPVGLSLLQTARQPTLLVSPSRLVSIVAFPLLLISCFSRDDAREEGRARSEGVEGEEVGKTANKPSCALRGGRRLGARKAATAPTRGLLSRPPVKVLRARPLRACGRAYADRCR